MIWLTWRQQRLETMIGGTALALVAIFLLWTGLNMASIYQHTGAAACVVRHAPGQTCQTITDAFQQQFSIVGNLLPSLNLLPLLLGILLAAPFVQELEQGTYRLAWTQSITRRRWVTVKLGLILLAAILVPFTLSVLVTWWHSPLDWFQPRLAPSAFDLEGIVPIAYTVFAVALGLTAGTLLRRTIPAVAVSFVGFLALRFGLETWVRPQYLHPLTKTLFGGLRPGDWVFGDNYRDHLGHQLTLADLQRVCGAARGQDVTVTSSCLHLHGIAEVVTYQPASRFWLFQGIESAIFGGLAVVLLAMAIGWVRYRVT